MDVSPEPEQPFSPQADPEGEDRQLLGWTSEHRPLWAFRRGPTTSDVRVLIVAGQHGDEGPASEVARRLLDPTTFDIPDRFGVQAWVVPVINPDGAARNSRTNGRGIDLNRDHAVLESEEITALHGLVRRIDPHLVLDLHTYPSRRLAWLARGWILDDDVMLATSTQPAVRSALPPALREDLIPSVGSRLERQGFAASEYKLFQSDGRVRRSTLQPVDLRNALALRYDLLTVLVEGRDPRRDEDARLRAHLLDAQLVAVEEILAWSVSHRAELARPRPALPAPGESIPTSARWGESARPLHATVRETISNARCRIVLKGASSDVEVTGETSLPWGYAIRGSAAPIIAWLQRQGFSGFHWAKPSFSPSPEGSEEIDAMDRGRISSADAVVGNGGSPRTVLPDDWFVVPVSQRGGHALAVWLEPGSSFRLPGSLIPSRAEEATDAYPVHRLTTIGR